MEHHWATILVLVTIAIAFTAVAKKIKQPYPILLVVVGLAIGLLPIPQLEGLKDFVAEDEVFGFAIISIFLPALLGETTLKLPFSHLRENAKPILALAIGGTFISFVVIGFTSNLVLGLSIQLAFTFAALMSATDPVSVLSIFKSLGVNKKLAITIEGESLGNDGVAVVLFHIFSSASLFIYMDAGLLGFGYGFLDLVKVMLGGLLIGGVFGLAFSWLIKYFDDYPLEIIFSVILFYGSFLIAEHWHVSGVIAVVTAGLIFGNYGSKIGMSPTTRMTIDSFWDVIALIANSLVFLMVGLEVTRINFADKWGLIVLAILIVLIGRSIAIYTSTAFIKNFPTKWKHIINYGGLKGSLSIALVLSLPHSFEGREDLLVLVFSVVLFSLIVQGMTIKWFISLVGEKNEIQEGTEEFAEVLSDKHSYKYALEELEKLYGQKLVEEDIYKELQTDLTERYELASQKVTSLYKKYPHIKKEQMEEVQELLLKARYQGIQMLSQKHFIPDNVKEEKFKDIIEKISLINKEH